MECKICYEQINDNMTFLFNDGKHMPADMCIFCISKLINTQLDSFINSIINETCETSLIRQVTRDFPSILTLDASGFGKPIDSIIFDGDKVDTKLKTNYSNNDFCIICEKINLIKRKVEINESNLIEYKNSLFNKN